ncbi:hypothetical protein [Chitinivorax sp. B]|uniref:hypothetical protein n=1 Tax=Chitinivorax sp. B TaxID=2502235 RepID=UPI0020182A7C|nr:hypothetical protein [Chitinivorax sp. B]
MKHTMRNWHTGGSLVLGLPLMLVGLTTGSWAVELRSHVSTGYHGRHSKAVEYLKVVMESLDNPDRRRARPVRGGGGLRGLSTVAAGSLLKCCWPASIWRSRR